MVVMLHVNDTLHAYVSDVPRSNFTDFKIILQTCAGLDQDDTLHAYVSDSPYK